MKVLPKVGEPLILMALPPVIMLPISYFASREKLGWRVIVGSLLAITGVAILFLA